MRLPRMTTRRWIIVVAVVALMLGLIVNSPVLGVMVLTVAILMTPQTILVAILMHRDGGTWEAGRMPRISESPTQPSVDRSIGTKHHLG
jgi:hypothetical protein